MLVCGHLELSDSSFPGREKPEISALALEILQVCICVLHASFFFRAGTFFRVRLCTCVLSRLTDLRTRSAT